MHAVTDLRVRFRNALRLQPAIDRLPRLAAVVAAECARGGDGDEDAVGIRRIEQDGVQAEAAGARLPRRAGRVTAETRQFLPALAAVRRAKQRGVLNARVNRIGIGP